MSALEDRIDWLARRGEIAPLTASQRALLKRIEESGVLEDLATVESAIREQEGQQTGWRREPVSPEQFLNDPYYAGEYAPVGRGLYPVLRRDFCNVFATDRPVTEVVFSGAIGNGKSFFVGWCMAYMLYLLSCMKNPHLYCGVEVGTPIVLVNLSVTGSQAKGSIYHYVRTVVDASPYFRDNFPRAPRIDSELRFPGGIVYQPGSSSAMSTIGRNVVAGAIDEANFLISANRAKHEKVQGEMQHAMHLYLEMADRVFSRFSFVKRGFRGRVFVASSALYAEDFVTSHVKKNEFRRWPEGDMYVMNYAHWEVRDPSLYDGRTFRVVVGSSTTPSKLLTAEEPTPRDAEVVVVPQHYYQRFRSDCTTALRNIAGRVSFGLNAYLDPQWVDRALCDADWDGEPLAHPTDDPQDEGVVLTEEYADRLVEAMTVEVPKLEDGKRVVYRVPRRAPKVPRYIHIDLAKKEDAAGFAMSFPHDWINDPDGGGRLPRITTELMFAAVAPAGGQIMFGAFRYLLYRLRRCGFQIAVVSFDTWQSTDSAQILEAQGFTVRQVSLDKDLVGYDQFRGALRDDRYRTYRHPVLLREAKKLERVLVASKFKVDHPAVDLGNPRGERGSKDIADAVAGTVLTIMTTESLAGAGVPAAARGESVTPRESRFENPMDSWILPERYRRPS